MQKLTRNYGVIMNPSCKVENIIDIMIACLDTVLGFLDRKSINIAM